MAYCSKCHAFLDNDACFCKVCGLPVSAPPVYTVSPMVSGVENPQWAAITALVCGILSIVLPCIPLVPAVLGIIFGIIGLKSTQKPMSIVGIVLGSIGVLLFILVVLYYIFVVAIIMGSMPDFSGDYSDVALALRTLV